MVDLCRTTWAVNIGTLVPYATALSGLDPPEIHRCTGDDQWLTVKHFELVKRLSDGCSLISEPAWAPSTQSHDRAGVLAHFR